MSDITSKDAAGKPPAPRRTRHPRGAPVEPERPDAGDGLPEVGLVPGVPAWRTTGTLSALQELVEVSETVPAVVARQAGLSTSELHSLRHLMRGPIGPVDLAKVLGVTSAASSGVVDRLVATDTPSVAHTPTTVGAPRSSSPTAAAPRCSPG